MPELTTLTTKETAERLGLSLATVNRLIQAGELKATKKTVIADQPDRNSPYLVDVQSVIEYEARRQAV